MTSLSMAIGACLLVIWGLVRSDGLLGAASVVIGIGIQLSSPWWGGAIPAVLGLLLLLAWWNSRWRRRHGMAGLGARSRELRDALARRMAERTIPLPAPMRDAL